MELLPLDHITFSVKRAKSRRCFWDAHLFPLAWCSILLERECHWRHFISCCNSVHKSWLAHDSTIACSTLRLSNGLKTVLINLLYGTKQHDCSTQPWCSVSRHTPLDENHVWQKLTVVPQFTFARQNDDPILPFGYPSNMKVHLRIPSKNTRCSSMIIKISNLNKKKCICKESGTCVVLNLP